MQLVASAAAAAAAGGGAKPSSLQAEVSRHGVSTPVFVDV